tara:strand:- start:629 stop:775 length:147 start_codon:yes stop_codon:yes gene_type:complete
MIILKYVAIGYNAVRLLIENIILPAMDLFSSGIQWTRASNPKVITQRQ